MSKLLHTNEHYEVEVGAIPYGDAKGQPCYVIRNKDTDVNEAFSYILPEAILTADRFSRALTRSESIDDLVGFDPDDGMPFLN